MRWPCGTVLGAALFLVFEGLQLSPKALGVWVFGSEWAVTSDRIHELWTEVATWPIFRSILRSNVVRHWYLRVLWQLELERSLHFGEPWGFKAHWLLLSYIGAFCKTCFPTFSVLKITSFSLHNKEKNALKWSRSKQI